MYKIAEALGAKSVIELEQTNATLQHAAAGRNWDGPIYVATPQLLKAFGIKPSTINPNADVLTMRPGLSGISKMQLTWSGGKGGSPNNNNSNPYACPRSSCRWNPVIQEIGALPSGTSAPNTVFTEHAIHTLGLQTSLASWLITTVHPPTAAQIRNARLLASTFSGMSLETRNSLPSGMEVLDLATLFGIVLSLAILAMSVGLIRSETASELRTLTATGASSTTRRTITAATRRVARVPRRVAGDGSGIRWDDRVHPFELLERRNLGARKCADRQFAGDPHRDADCCRARRVVIGGTRATRDRPPADRVRRASLSVVIDDY